MTRNVFEGQKFRSDTRRQERVGPKGPTRCSSVCSHSQSAFSMVEILVGVAILGILSALATFGIRHILLASKIEQARQDLARIATAIENLTWDTGQWPGGRSITLSPQQVDHEFENLNLPAVGLLSKDGRFNNWRGPYIDRIPRDPWGTRYFFDADYRIRNQGPWITVIGSYGPNRRGRNRYDDDDIVHSLEHIYRRTQ